MKYLFSLFILVLFMSTALFAQEGTIKDIDGNEYRAGKIGTQFWMFENLKTTRYSDGSAIGEVEDETLWNKAYESQTAAWGYYESNPANNPTYGKLYNGYAVADARNVCPTGWHVPSIAEFNVLCAYLGGDQVAGGRMKDVSLWSAPNTGADNSSGFTAVPGGNRYAVGGKSSGLGTGGGFWFSMGVGNAWINYNSSVLNKYNGVLGSGLSVRCIAD